MGSSPPTPPTLPRAGEGRASLGDRWRGMIGGMSSDRLGQWWRQANSPVLMRVPRGYLVLAGAALLLLLGLAYWVGGARGYSRAIADMEAGSAPHVMVRPGEGSPPPTQGVTPRVTDGSPGAPRRDPRVAGKNYLIVATYPLAEAERLIAFLKDRQIDAIGVPVDAGRDRCRVIVLRGFDGSEVRDTAESPGTKFKDEMRRIGRQWKAHNGGRGDDLASMYFSRYDLPSP